MKIIIQFISILCIALSSQFALAQTTGVASYYSNTFHGENTASGEKYNKDYLTAAHPTLPFDTLVIVTNLTNGESVVVRVNDRGPHTKSRIIDVSEAAAKKLDLINQGVAEVKLEVLDDYFIKSIPTKNSN
ncbi:septal ring lytic transglycosylase RlpA family protein [Formosa sp. 4Alg 33]|uniref:septal ring lytic transglycosylase RlpA family protein n=1 Tax=Formosa sp. 4Alg 33 TaxID=3382189 RepID=UPI003D9C2EC7